MSNNNDDTDDVVGTANNNKQHRRYRDLSERYTPEGASHIAAANLRRNGKPATARMLQAWDQVTRWNHEGAMDLDTEDAIAATMVNAHTDAVMGRNQDTPALAAQPAPVTAVDEEAEWDEDEEEDEKDEEDEGPVDFGYDNEEDNAEARADYIRKLNDL